MQFICEDMMPDEPEQPQGNVESTSMISVGTLVLTAILTGAVSYGYGVASDIRKTKIAFVDEQIQKLYGPLYAESQPDDKIWHLFVTQRWKNPDAPDESPKFFDDKAPPTIEQVRRWRRWMRTVYQPLNTAMETAITSNIQLMVGDDIPIPLRSLIAHTELYKAVIAGWGADEDLKDCEAKPGLQCPALMTFRNTSGLNYPDGVIKCVADDYLNLKQWRDKLELSFFKVFRKSSPERSAACDREFRSSVESGASASPRP